MGLFNLFKRKRIDNNSINNKININVSPTRIKDDNSQTDISEDDIVNKLFEVRKSNRDDSWVQTFLENIVEAKFQKKDLQAIEGPDGFSYFNLQLSKSKNKAEYFVIKDIIPSLLKDGIGITINANKDSSEWVFTYGDIIDFYLNGKFYSNVIKAPFGGDSVVDLTIGTNRFRIGTPSESYLPMEARKAIKIFLESFGINSKIALLLWVDDSNKLTLAFNIVPTMFNNISDELFKSFLSHLSWYLPRHYQIISMKENEYFVSL